MVGSAEASFMANSAWLVLAAMASNLIRASGGEQAGRGDPGRGAVRRPPGPSYRLSYVHFTREKIPGRYTVRP
ncbi:MAG: hypothetical protein NVSMB13_04430 [Mycobacteriales bacterium]